MGERREGCELDLDLGLGFPGLHLASINHDEQDPQSQLQPLRFPSRIRDSEGDDGRSRQREGAMWSKTVGDVGQRSFGSADSGGNARKKLRLTEEQTSLLEESFRWNNILNTLQKQELAAQLNLKPRQVEVWFQNRRARTKVKQTEVDCQTLRKWCEHLHDENQRLRKELLDLRLAAAASSSAPSNSSSASPSKASGTLCFACNRIVEVGSGTTGGENVSSNNSTASSSDVVASAEALELKLYG